MQVGVWIRRIAVGLVVGVIATIAVAWWFTYRAAIAPGPSTLVRYTDPVTAAVATIRTIRGTGHQKLEVVASPLWPPNETAVVVHDRPAELPHGFGPNGGWACERYGWPLPALEWQRGSAGAAGTSRRHADVMLEAGGGYHQVPVVPMWATFAIDTLLYGAAYVALASVVSVVKRRAQIRIPRLRPSPWLARLLIGAAVGVVVTVIVAWGVTVFVLPTADKNALNLGSFRHKSGVAVSVGEIPAFGMQIRWANREESSLQRFATIERPEWVPENHEPDHWWMRQTYGWPLRAMAIEHLYLQNPVGSPSENSLTPIRHPTLLRITTPGSSYALPFDVVPGAFVADAIVFGSLYVGLAYALARARRRRRAGLCPKCLYSLRGLAPDTPCPECGTAPVVAE